MLNARNRQAVHKRLYHVLVGKQMLDAAKSVIFSSALEMKQAMGFGLDQAKGAVIPNGINVPSTRPHVDNQSLRSKLAVKPDEKLIVWLGRIEPIKNLESLISALAEIQDLPWRLAIIGPKESAEYFERLQRQIARLKMENRVRFLPPVYDDDKWAVLAGADLLALVSHYESWGIVAAEAVVSGVPVLITESCGFAGGMNKRGGLVVANDTAAIRDGLRRLMSDGPFYASCKSQLQTLAGELTWETAIKKLADVFQKGNNRRQNKI
jgi:glycosyltransferase involved in cell wall biosynthesis